MERAELDRALERIGVEDYLDREGIDYHPSYGTRGLQLNLTECPACHEGGRKTYINADSGLGNCFHGSCGFKFNKFKLIRAVSGLAGKALDDHITSVAEDAGWLPKRKRVELVQGELKLPTKLYPIPAGDGRHLRYLAERGITEATAIHFGLKYCAKGWWEAKLADGSSHWVSFDRRVVIPIADLDGELVSFQGRDTTGTLEPKYLFPKGFAVAGSHLYNGHTFVEGTHTHALIGEGAFDAMAIHQAITGSASCGAMLPLATFGMHLSEGPDGQVAKLLRLKGQGLKTITMLWDPEKAAMILAVKAGLKLVAHGFTVQIALLRGGDPNEVPPEAVRRAIFQAVKLDRISAIRLMTTAVSIVKA